VANKTVANRQKLVFRLDPTQSKPRNNIAVKSKLTGAGSHEKTPVMLRKRLKQDLKKLPIDKELD
jgi:hypothetical protein